MPLMNLGIVGNAQEKFTAETESLAHQAIADAITRHGATRVVSGRCPMGGVDLYAEGAAAWADLPTTIFPPTVNRWDGPGGFRARNLLIAASSDLVLVVVVAKLPPGFEGRDFGDCYHCKGRNPEHVKSGGCWTAWRCKVQEWIIV